MNIMEFIPTGHENGIALKELCARCGLSERVTREEIEEARKKSVILNLQDGAGYFTPAENEAHFVKEWVAQQMARANSVREGCKKAKLWLYHHGLDSQGNSISRRSPKRFPLRRKP